MRRSPLLDFPLLPRSKGSIAEEVVAMMAREEEGKAPVLIEGATKTPGQRSRCRPGVTYMSWRWPHENLRSRANGHTRTL